MNIMPKPHPHDPENPLFGGTFGVFIKVAFMLIVIAGMVVDCAGKGEKAVIIFVITSLIWTCSKILNEGLAALETILSKKEKDGNDEE